MNKDNSENQSEITEIDIKQVNENFDIKFTKNCNEKVFTNDLSEKLTEDRSNTSKYDSDENIYKARLLHLYANLLFVVSTNEIKHFFLIRQERGRIVFGIYRFFGIILYSLIKKMFDNTIVKKNVLDILSYDKETLYWLKWRIFCLVTTSILVLLSIIHLKLAVNLCVFLTMPIFTNLLAVAIGGEKFQIKYIIACIISFIGTIIISIGKDEIDNYAYKRNFYLGLISTLLNAFLIALLSITMKKLGNKIDIFNLNYVTSWFSIFFLLLICIVYSITIDSREILCLFDIVEIVYALINGLLIGKNYSLLFESFKLADASKTSYITYIQLPVGTFVSYLFFGEILNGMEILGCVIIVVNVVFFALFVK